MLRLFDVDTPPGTQARVLLAVVLAIIGVASSAIIVRHMHDISPVAIATWRTFGAALVLAPSLYGVRSALSRAQLVSLLLAGAMLGAHFATWFAAIGYTSVMRATVLVCTAPLWTGVLEALVLRTPPRRAFWLGALIALPGVALLGASSPATGVDSSFGDALSFFSGALWSIYALLTRSARRTLGAAPIMAIVCAAASVSLLPVAWYTDAAMLGYTSQTWWLLALALVGPQLFGHQGFTYALKYISASSLSLLTLFEPVGATLLAWALLGEVPGPLAIVGALVLLAGVGVASR